MPPNGEDLKVKHYVVYDLTLRSCSGSSIDEPINGKSSSTSSSGTWSAIFTLPSSSVIFGFAGTHSEYDDNFSSTNHSSSLQKLRNHNVAHHDKIYTDRGCDAALYIKQCTGYNTVFKPSNDSANILVLESLSSKNVGSFYLSQELPLTRRDHKFTPKAL
uniref:Uncharacterized protein n=1 Tax=Glossina pallidipes TaxID=7398 RepID=A0A1A9ZXG9_GLOPL